VCSVIKSISRSEALQVNDLHNIKRNLYSAKRKKFPSLPKSGEEVQNMLDDIQVVTNRDENCIFSNDKENGIIIFGCKTNLKMLSTAEWIYMDGTFEYSSNFFSQLFTIHGYFNGRYIPLVFCLLKAKTQNIYLQCFTRRVPKVRSPCS